MRIAIIGAGISGLVAARELHGCHDLTLFEAADYIGGHTHTVDVEFDGERLAIDTGFIVYNEQTYPLFTRLLAELGVRTKPTSMGFSVRDDASGLEYSGSGLNGLFAQRGNFLKPGHYRMLRDILRFHREGPSLLEDSAADPTVAEYLTRGGYSREFAEYYLLPMGSAIWSCPRGSFAQFPMRFIIEFYRNHGLLQVTGRPVWRVIQGGSRRYVERLVAPFRDRIRLRTPVKAVTRGEHGVTVCTALGQARFDHVILACHTDQALAMLSDPTPVERELLGCFPYEQSRALLHTDSRILPRRRRAWAAWNYRLLSGGAEQATVTYNMSILQGLRARHVYNVTLNAEHLLDPDRILARFTYHHPVYSHRAIAARQRHAELACANRTSFCGAYWGNGFHEDGVASAHAVCQALRGREVTCTAPSTRGTSVTGDPNPWGMSSVTGCS